VNRRFATTDDDTIQKSSPCFQEPEKDFLADTIMADFLYFLRQYKLAIVTIPTAHVTAHRKNNRSDFARIIEEGGFFYAGKQHTEVLLYCAILSHKLRIV